MLDRTHPTVVRFGNAVRARFGKMTSFRLGYLVGESGEGHGCPYDDVRGRAGFLVGVDAGRESAERKRQYLKEEQPAMTTDEVLEAIQRFFADKSRSPAETRDGLIELAEHCEMLADSLPKEDDE